MPHSTVISQRTIAPNQKIDVAPLQTIDYSLIAKEDPSEIDRLLHACQTLGFFHLDLSNEPSGEALPLLQQVYTASKDHFTHNEKQQMFELRQDSLNHLTLPDTLQPHNDPLTRFAHTIQNINLTILTVLSTALQLPRQSRFESTHQPSQPSDTALNLIYSPALPLKSSAADNTHTDQGTLTSLFCEDWGIQIEMPSPTTTTTTTNDKSEDPASGEERGSQWAWCEPKPGCALVNVADWLGRASAGIDENRVGGGCVTKAGLRSSRHRHTQVGDGFRERWFVVGYLRPGKGEGEATQI